MVTTALTPRLGTVTRIKSGPDWLKPRLLAKGWALMVGLDTCFYSVGLAYLCQITLGTDSWPLDLLVQNL